MVIVPNRRSSVCWVGIKIFHYTRLTYLLLTIFRSIWDSTRFVGRCQVLIIEAFGLYEKVAFQSDVEESKNLILTRLTLVATLTGNDCNTTGSHCQKGVKLQWFGKYKSILHLKIILLCSYEVMPNGSVIVSASSHLSYKQGCGAGTQFSGTSSGHLNFLASALIFRSFWLQNNWVHQKPLHYL